MRIGNHSFLIQRDARKATVVECEGVKNDRIYGLSLHGSRRTALHYRLGLLPKSFDDLIGSMIYMGRRASECKEAPEEFERLLVVADQTA